MDFAPVRTKVDLDTLSDADILDGYMSAERATQSRAKTEGAPSGMDAIACVTWGSCRKTMRRDNSRVKCLRKCAPSEGPNLLWGKPSGRGSVGALRDGEAIR